MIVNRKRLRIAMVSVHSSPLGELGSQDTGGMSVYIRELACELARTGHYVDIYTSIKNRKQNRELILSDHVRLIYLHIGGNGHVPKGSLYPYLPGFFESLENYRTLNGPDYDLIHSHYWLSGRVGTWAKHCWNVPHIMTFHTTGMAKRVSCSDERESQLRLVIEKKLAHECDRIIAPTERERALLNRYYAVPRTKIGLVPCGVDLETFRILSKEVARKQMGLQKCGPVILYVGRFAPVKGIDRLMAAMTHMRKKGVKLIIAGGDGIQSHTTALLRRCARRLQIHNDVIFAGRVNHEDLACYYNAADVLAVPSYYESFGLVALESLACGTPVVATRVGAMDSLVQNGETGEIVDSPSPRGIARALEKIISYQEKGLISRKAVRTSVIKYSWLNVASAVRDEYAEMLESSEFMALNSQRQIEVVCGSSC